MPNKTFTLASGKSFEEMGIKVASEGLHILGRGLYKEALGIMAASQPLVPVDTGALRSSGYVTEPIYDEKSVQVILGYGGPAARINPKSGESTDGYAMIVHENLDAYHKVGSALYLQIPFDQAITGMGERLGQQMREDKSKGTIDLGGSSEE